MTSASRPSTVKTGGSSRKGVFMFVLVRSRSALILQPEAITKLSLGQELLGLSPSHDTLCPRRSISRFGLFYTYSRPNRFRFKLHAFKFRKMQVGNRSGSAYTSARKPVRQTRDFSGILRGILSLSTVIFKRGFYHAGQKKVSRLFQSSTYLVFR